MWRDETAHKIEHTSREKVSIYVLRQRWELKIFFLLEFSRITELFSSPGKCLVSAKVSHKCKLPPSSACWLYSWSISYLPGLDMGHKERERERHRDKRHTEKEGERER